MTSSPDPYSNNRAFLPHQHLFSRCGAKKGPENPISVVDGKPGGVRERPMTDPPVSTTRRAQPACPYRAARRARGRRWRAPSRCAPPCPLRGTRPAAGHPRGPPLLAGRVPARIDAWLGAGCKASPAPGGADLTERPERRLYACGPGRQASAPRLPASGPAATAPGNGD